jgi:hypothetical protein
MDVTPMTMAGEPQRIHPLFLRNFEEHTAGLTFEPSARRLVMRVLTRGSQAFRDTEQPERDSGFQEAAARLDAAMSTIADELVSRGITQVDEAGLSLLMQAQCPLPPFCYGPETSAGSGAASDPEMTAKEPALADG